MINKEQLKQEEYTRYQSYYCGLCHVLKKRYGRMGQFILSYDMTFLTILLSSLYEKETTKEIHRCMVHPLEKRSFLINEFTEYAADMTILLSYQNFLDDWEDDHNYIKYVSSNLLQNSYYKVKLKYERQSFAVEHYIKYLHEIESSKERNLDIASGATGHMLKEIFSIKADEWTKELQNLSFYLGKFIYLMDAYDDIEKDIKSGAYNPFIQSFYQEDFDEYCKKVLMLVIAACAKAFECLPIVEDVGILRNILYSGIWCKFEVAKKKRKSKSEL